MKVISLNINGIRSGGRKGFFDWLQAEQPDVLCLQETKAQRHQLDDELYHPPGYYDYFCDAEKKGYSGVAIYSKQEPKKIIYGFGWPESDREGRYIQVDLPKFSVGSLYLPSGTSGDVRQQFKFHYLDFLTTKLVELKAQKRPYIICGDYNIIHKEIDIKNFKSNQKTSGCLPEERAWLDELFAPGNFVDAFRVLNHEPDQYTWWSNRGQAYAKNVGWRIDYQVITPDLTQKVRSVSIYKEQKFSDHAPLIVEYDL